MKFYQHIYTSCPKGWGGTQGWQTKRKSKEINTETMRGVEQYAPYSNPNRPGTNDSARAESFRVFRVGGFAVISLAQPVEKHFQNRPGNYFIHSLVCEESRLREIQANPFRVYRARPFICEDSSEYLDIDSLDVEIGPAEDDLKRCWDQCGDLCGIARTFLDAVLSGDRQIILVDGAEEQRDAFIEAMACLLPYSLRAQFSFSTLNHDPVEHNLYRCSATLSGGKTGFKPNTHTNSKFYVFDLAAPGSKPEPSKRFSYAKMVAGLWADGKFDELRKVIALFDGVDFEGKAELLDGGVSVLGFFDNKDRGPLDEKGLAFYDLCLRQPVVPPEIIAMSAKLPVFLNTCIDQKNTDAAENCFRLLLAGRKRQGVPPQFEDATGAIINLFYFLLEKKRPEAIKRLLDGLRELGTSDTRVFWSRFASPENREFYQRILPESESPYARDWLTTCFVEGFAGLAALPSLPRKARLSFYIEVVFASAESEKALYPFLVDGAENAAKSGFPLALKFLYLSIIKQLRGASAGAQVFSRLFDLCVSYLSKVNDREVLVSLCAILQSSPDFERDSGIEAILRKARMVPELGARFCVALLANKAAQKDTFRRVAVEDAYLMFTAQVERPERLLEIRLFAMQHRLYDLVDRDIYLSLCASIAVDDEDNGNAVLKTNLNHLISMCQSVDAGEYPSLTARLRSLRAFPKSQPKIFTVIENYLWGYFVSLPAESDACFQCLFEPYLANRLVSGFKLDQRLTKHDLALLASLDDESRFTELIVQKAKSDIIRAICRKYPADAEKQFCYFISNLRLLRQYHYLDFNFRLDMVFKMLVPVWMSSGWNRGAIMLISSALFLPSDVRRKEEFFKSLADQEWRQTFGTALTEYLILDGDAPWGKKIIKNLIAKAKEQDESRFETYRKRVQDTVENFAQNLRKVYGDANLLPEAHFPLYKIWKESTQKKTSSKLAAFRSYFIKGFAK